MILGIIQPMRGSWPRTSCSRTALLPRLSRCVSWRERWENAGGRGARDGAFVTTGTEGVHHIAPPIKIRDVAPVYPASVRGSGFEGRVVLDGLIRTDGTVEVLQILAPVDPSTMTTEHPDLARAAVEAVGGWRYEPTLLHGVPVDTRMAIRVTFRP